ncbi:MAG: DUF4845 domain-containing protein [Betaproteobacteria bacterium]|nr:DUF4845 domain-containing protein [Betaproteobacteria bacterium]
MRRQKGLALSGLLFICALLIVVALLVFKLFPAYAEYLTVKKALSDIMHNPEYRSSTREIQAAFERRVTIDNIRAVGSKDLEIAKQGDSVSVSASWSVKVPLFYNLSACMDFEARGE